jgi:hypothetical protein
MPLTAPTEGFTVTALLDEDTSYPAARVEATPEGVHMEFTRVEDDGQATGPWLVYWDRLTAERIARAILAELAATRR